MFGTSPFALTLFAALLTGTDEQPTPTPGPILGFITEPGVDEPGEE